MPLLNWIAASSALLFALLVGAFIGTTHLFAPTATILTVATSTPPLSTIVETSVAPLAEPASDTTSTPAAPLPPVKAKVVPKTKTPIAATSTKVGEAPPPVFTLLLPPTQSEFESAANKIRSALINILCESHTSNIQSVSGSGVIVDPRGIILTNAHIAQYFLLASDPKEQVSCTIRVGSPAQSAYEAKLLFISPAWLHANGDTLSKTRPTGTGERDFAILAITKSTTQTPLPTNFSFVPLSQYDVFPTESVVIGSYAAQFLTSEQIRFNLSPTIVFGSIQKVFTFAENTIDVFALGGSVAAQEGSSGGGVVDANGNLIGTIVTSTVEGDTSTRNVSAISAAYIARDYLAETGTSLPSLFTKNLADAISDFASQIPALLSLISH